MRWSSSNGEKESRKGRSSKYIHAADCCPNYNSKVSPKERLAQDSPRRQCRTSSTAVPTRVLRDRARKLARCSARLVIVSARISICLSSQAQIPSAVLGVGLETNHYSTPVANSSTGTAHILAAVMIGAMAPTMSVYLTNVCVKNLRSRKSTPVCASIVYM